ncbi:hypothetical protein K491DRAFT_690204 [Lophiostoma macrostomum CBS 122681]|uniref:Mid2 domain-containing protein n=1 Tax=Lophiostoma macrostomum CBS 122681 TaxID=1314788 RepID=A0A6A6TE12_9PLEO|nr:hypothetical protein K491DRAFT_690204 [Lophiostoma macrostomum CBS 122681]
MALSLRVLSILLLPAILRSTLASTCYYPSGATNSSLVPCNSTSTSSTTCCASGWQCLSNGLCADPQYENQQRLSRGGCTDKNWGNGCITHCKAPSDGDGDEPVYYCGGGKYCCHGADCCSESRGIIDLGDPVVVATARESTASSTQTPSQSIAKTTKTADASSTQQHASEDTSSSPTPISSSPPKSQVITYSDGEKVTVPIPTRTRSFAQQSADLAESNDKGKAIGIGVGVGGGITIFAIIFGTWICMRRRKRHKKPQGVTSRSVESVNPFESRRYVVELVREPPSVGEVLVEEEPGGGRGKGKSKRKDKERVAEKPISNVIQTAPF